MPKILDWAKAHPVETGGIVFVGGVIIYFLFFSGGSSSSSGDASSGASAYYAAEAAQGVAGDQLQAVQIQSQAATAQDLINANAAQNINTTWATANTNVAATQAASAVQLAPYAVENNLVSTLGSVASIAPTTVTSVNQSNNSGFFGIGASNSTSTSTNIVPNPASVDAAGLLSELTTTGFNASS